MDLKFITKLIRIMNRADLQELEVEEEGKRVRLKKRDAITAAAPQIIYSARPGAEPQLSTASAELQAPVAALAAGVVEFRSPMVGTFYKAPSPDAEAFVAKGSKVQNDSTLCIIEAMKVMNEIKAELEGEVVEILAKNGDAVEFGQSLFLIKTR